VDEKGDTVVWANCGMGREALIELERVLEDAGFVAE
jgi:hypothetical protein